MAIWLRRLLALLLVPLFIALFTLVLLTLRINATLGNPQFYIDQLRQADTYNWFYAQLFPAALKEVRIDPWPKGPKLDTEKLKELGRAAAQQTFPPDWLQIQVEEGIRRFLPYLLGDTQRFTITVPLKDRVEVAGKALKDTLLTEDAFPSLYDPLMAYAVDQALPLTRFLPYSRPFRREELESALHTIVPPEWLRGQATQAVDELVPYLTGQAEHFTLRIELRDRVEVAEKVLRPALGEQNWAGLQPLLQRVSQGRTITEADLDLALGPGGQARLEEARERLTQGFTFTEKDFRERLANSGDALQGLDRMRSPLGWARRWRFLAWLGPGLLLAMIALLGGRGLRGKVAWAGAVLAIAATFTYLASGPAYSAILRPGLEGLLAQGANSAQGVEAVVLEMGATMVKSGADAFFSGLRGQALLALGVGAGGLTLARLWGRLPRRGKA